MFPHQRRRYDEHLFADAAVVTDLEHAVRSDDLVRRYVDHAAVWDLVVVGCAGFAGVAREGVEGEAVVGCREAELGGEVDGRLDDLLVELG